MAETETTCTYDVAANKSCRRRDGIETFWRATKSAHLKKACVRSQPIARDGLDYADCPVDFLRRNLEEKRLDKDIDRRRGQ